MGSGLNILTGETGAGKSILIDSLGAILGHRISADSIRTGCDWLRVEAVFSLDDESLGLHELLNQQAIDDSEGFICDLSFLATTKIPDVSLSSL